MNIKMLGMIRQDCQEALENHAQLLSPLKGETLVVTGGTGFVGTWLAEMVALLNDEHAFKMKLVLLSRSSDLFRTKLPHLSNRKDISLLKADVRQAVDVPKETGWIIHAAANPNNRFHSSCPVETMTVIADGTVAMLRTAERCSNLKNFLNLSSGLVYGPQPLTLDRIPESYVGGPSSGSVSSVYAEAKRYGETMGAAFRSQARIPVITARPFAFIGPYQSLENPWAINNFIHDSLSGNPIRVLGDGLTVRSYMYPSDMAFWLLRILTAGQSGAHYNVGSPEGIALKDLAAMVAEQVVPRPEILLQTAPSAQNRKSRFVPDVTYATESLGLRITVPLKTALERTIRWNRSKSE